MSIPDYQSLMLPLLKAAADGKEHRKRDVLNDLAKQFELTESERKALLPSGNQAIFDNRLGWARTYLKKAGLIEYTQRGHFQLTDPGKDVLAHKPQVINVAYLRQFPEFVEFHSPKRTPTDVEPPDSPESITETPEELLASGSLKLRRQAEQELLGRVKACPAEFFERLVVKLLTTIGYGGSLADAGNAIGKAGDGGIDGVIKEDKLGLDLLYIQAKKWDDTTVGRPEIQKFVGALHGKRARKGIFMTTSTFSKEATEYAEGVETKVILIDGARLTELMFDYGVGVTTVNSYVVKRIDSDFFDDEISAEDTKTLDELGI
jgi:restriction system protein